MRPCPGPCSGPCGGPALRPSSYPSLSRPSLSRPSPGAHRVQARVAAVGAGEDLGVDVVLAWGVGAGQRVFAMRRANKGLRARARARVRAGRGMFALGHTGARRPARAGAKR